MQTNHFSTEEGVSFLAEASKLLTSSLDYELILHDIAKLVVPQFADWCTIDLIEDGEIRTVAATHGNPERQVLADQWRSKWPVNQKALGGSPQVIRTGRSEIYPLLTEQMLKSSALNDGHFAAMRNLEIKSAMVVPLRGQREIFGAVTFIGAESNRLYSEINLELAEKLGCTAGAAIENALLYRRAKQAQERAEKSERLLRVTADRLIENEGRFRRLAEAVPHLTWTSLPSGEVDYFNDRWSQYTGLEPKHHFDFWRAVIAPEHFEEVMRTWQDSFASKEIFEIELLVRDFNGFYFWHLARAIPSKDSSGNILRWFGTCTNIDSQKRQEDRLLKLQEITAALSRAVTAHQVAETVSKNRSVFLSAESVLFMVLNEDHTRLKVLKSIGSFVEFAKKDKYDVAINRESLFFEAVRAQRPLFFNSTEELLVRYAANPESLDQFGRNALAVLPLVFQGTCLGLIILGFNNEKHFSSEDKSFLVSAGQQCVQALERSRLFDSELTARHRAEDAQYRLSFLAEASTRLSETLDKKKIAAKFTQLCVPMFADGTVVALLNENGKLEFFSGARVDRSKDDLLNEVFKTENLSLTGEHPVAALLQGGRSILVENDDEVLTKTLLFGRAHEDSSRIQKMNFKSLIVTRLGVRNVTAGLIFFFTSASARAFSREDLGIAEELTRRTSLALENSKLYNEAQKAVNIRDEFLSIASHELKTPLTSIKLQLQIMKRMRAQNVGEAVLENKIDRAIEVFDSQSERLDKLVDSLLDISKIQAGRLSIDPENVNLSELVRQVIDRFVVQLSSTKCRVEMTLDERVEGHWDRLRLEQVFTNLMTNAIKYGNERPIQVRTFFRNGVAFLSVQDFGIGIAPADQQRIFDRFERAVTDRTTWGLGLGLYISRQIVESHNGRIHVRSEHGQGSTFTVELPMGLMKGSGVSLAASINLTPPDTDALH